MNPYFLFPFTFELIYDTIAIRLGKKDLHWGWRPFLFLPTAIDYSASTWSHVEFSTGALILCIVPYFFFDNFLNLLRFWKEWGVKRWDYLKSALDDNPKFWDSALRHIPVYMNLRLGKSIIKIYIRTPLRFAGAVGVCWLAWVL